MYFKSWGLIPILTLVGMGIKQVLQVWTIISVWLSVQLMAIVHSVLVADQLLTSQELVAVFVAWPLSPGFLSTQRTWCRTICSLHSLSVLVWRDLRRHITSGHTTFHWDFLQVLDSMVWCHRSSWRMLTSIRSRSTFWVGTSHLSLQFWFQLFQCGLQSRRIDF